MTADEQAIADLFGRWFRAMETGDTAALRGLLAEGFLLKLPGRPPLDDADALATALDGFHAQYTETVEHELEDVQVAGRWAWARVSERTAIVPRHGNEGPMTVSGTHLAILTQDAGGTWRLFRDVVSLDE